MNRVIKCLFAAVLGIVLVAIIPATRVYASSTQFWLDFGETTMSIDAGSQKSMWLRSDFDYTYFIEGATSNGTYLECSFKSGSQNVTFHIGDDEQSGNVFFHFYANDPRLASDDAHDCVEIYVQNRKQAVASLPVTLAGGKTGSLARKDNVAMLYNAAGVPMASFSLSKGDGNMVSFGIQSIVNNGGNYFAVVTSNKDAILRISESDKAVMLANGYAGVCIDGKYVNWP